MVVRSRGGLHSTVASGDKRRAKSSAGLGLLSNVNLSAVERYTDIHTDGFFDKEICNFGPTELQLCQR